MTENPGQSLNHTMHTRNILFLSNLLQEPFIALNLMLDVMLSAHFGASALQISMLITLRPILAVCAFYWGSVLHYKPAFLKLSLVIASVLATSLFLFAPWAESIWYFILAESCFILFGRAAQPARLEILKNNLPKGLRERIFSQSLCLSHASGMILGLILCVFFKVNPVLWKELYCVAAIFYIASGWIQSFFYVPPPTDTITESFTGLKNAVILPWKDSWRLLKANKAFAQFQIGFFIAGSGLMFAKPSIPGYLNGMKLSFMEIFLLFTLLEGLGFILTSHLWAKFLEKVGINKTSTLVACCFALQPLLFIAPFEISVFVFLAYFFYGAAQAGSKLVWNLSGPILCGKESSSQYTSVNILAIGVRGCFVPFLGATFTQLFSSEATFFISFLCMLAGAFYLFKVSAQEIVLKKI